MATFTGVVTPYDIEAYNLKLEPGTGGTWFTGASGRVAVIDQQVANLLNVKPGDDMFIPGAAPAAGEASEERWVSTQPAAPTTAPATAPASLRVKVVAVIHKPQILAFVHPTVYVPLETLQEFTGHRGQITRILIDLRPGVNDDAFAERWKSRLSEIDPHMKIKPASESRKEVDKHLQGAELLSYLGGTISLLAATFIVFATLSMGVAERQRTLAMLRAVGATRPQIGSLVLLEAVLLASVAAMVGLPLGLLWVRILAWLRPDYFQAGVVPNVGGLIYGAFGSIAAAMAAAFLPAWNAMRVSPVEGMAAAGQPPPAHVPWRVLVLAVMLVAVDPVLMFYRAIPDGFAYYGHFFLGLPCLMLGFFLFAPAMVWLVEKTLGRAVAVIVRVQHGLLSQQLSGSLWRSSGTAAALMVGLAILVVMHTQGNSMLEGWRLPDRFPDLFILAPGGVNESYVKELEKIPGIQHGEVLPIAFDWAGLIGSASPVGADATMFIGVDPDKGLNMMHLEFLEGSREEATALLKQGKHVIVTDELRQLRHIHKGDKIKLRSGFRNLTYTVAGVVWSPGIDVFVAMFDAISQFQQRSVGTAFGSLKDAKEDFGISDIRLFAANVVAGTERLDIQAKMGKAIEKLDTEHARTLREKAMLAIRRELGAYNMISGDVRVIKMSIQAGFRRLLMLVSLVALAAIIVAALGVTNTIMASIRTRRWQLGILRSIGLTRWQMMRMIFAESSLLALVGCVLGLVAGLEMCVNAHGLSYRLFGYRPPMLIAWDMAGWGCVTIFGAAILASIWPAIHSAAQEPLELLTAGARRRDDLWSVARAAPAVLIAAGGGAPPNIAAGGGSLHRTSRPGAARSTEHRDRGRHAPPVIDCDRGASRIRGSRRGSRSSGRSHRRCSTPGAGAPVRGRSGAALTPPSR